MRHNYTQEENQFLIDNVKGKSRKELTDMFNKRFNCNVSESSIQNRKNVLHIKSEYNPTQFKKGQTPYNKGLKMSKEQYEKKKNTFFKKGNRPANVKEVGTEVVDICGYTKIKVAEPNKWEFKSKYIYEKAYGKLDKNMNVIFLNGNKQDFRLENLCAVTKTELLFLNKNGLLKNDSDLSRVSVSVAKLIAKISERKKR